MKVSVQLTEIYLQFMIMNTHDKNSISCWNQALKIEK